MNSFNSVSVNVWDLIFYDHSQCLIHPPKLQHYPPVTTELQPTILFTPLAHSPKHNDGQDSLIKCCKLYKLLHFQTFITFPQLLPWIRSFQNEEKNKINVWLWRQLPSNTICLIFNICLQNSSLILLWITHRETRQTIFFI